jgi:hypothetical protein
MLAGCNDGGTDRQAYSSNNSLSSLTINSAISSTINPASSSSDYVKTYADKTHKELQYGKLSIDFDDYHIVSDTRSDSNETFQCEIDKGAYGPQTLIIKVRAIEKQAFSNTVSIVSYLSKLSPDYDELRIYSNMTNDSGIIGLYCAVESKLSHYVVCYQDDWYLVESDYSILDIYLSKNEPNYEIDKLKIKCADSYTTNVNETITYNKDEFEKAGYEIIQGKGGTKYSAELCSYEEGEYNFTLKNEKGKNLLTLSTYGGFDEIIKFLDVNMDGYADIQFLEQSGALNNSYALYVWDNSSNNFIKVKCEEMLSNFEVHDGFFRKLAETRCRLRGHTKACLE